MKRKFGAVVVLCIGVLIAGCGMQGEDDQNGVEEPLIKNGQKTVSDREIIASLEQTVTETPKRDEAVHEMKESTEYKEGYFGEPSKELEEEMAVQTIEAIVVFDAVEEVYGGHEGFKNAGISFLENKSQGAVQSGVWVGIKEPDERVDELLKLLQSKVDAGEILAEPIYIFRSAHTGMDLHVLQDEVAKALKPMEPENGSFGLSVDTITGDIEITHDFLTEAQQKDLRKKFAAHTVHFEQDGRLVAEPGKPMTTFPDQEFTTEPPIEGGYVLSVGEEEIFVAGGDHGAAYYEYPEAHKLKVGQRIVVEAAGYFMESDPPQGRAKFVEVLPVYKPEAATLSETDVVLKALALAKQKTDWFMFINSLTFDEETAMWKVVINQEDEEYELEIKDE